MTRVSSFASRLSSSTARWPAEPYDDVAKVYLAGFSRTSAKNVLRSFAATPGVVLTSRGPDATSETGVKSFTTS